MREPADTNLSQRCRRKRAPLSLALWLVWFASLLLALPIGAAESTPPRHPSVAAVAEPTADEMAALAWTNALRTDPAGAIDQLLAGARFGFAGMGHDIDWELCRSEVAALDPVPPLVFSLPLLDAARGQARYLIANRTTGHFQQREAEAFTAVDPFSRMALAGYRGMPLSENSFTNATTVLNAHRGFVVDWGAGPGGMQVGRGHRASLLDPRADEVGIAVLPHHRHWRATVQNFGRSRTPRLLGGLVYVDRNRNERFDAGEGVGGVTVTIEAETEAEPSRAVPPPSARTWGCGGFRLELTDREAFTCVAQHQGRRLQRVFPAGRAPARLVWRLPQGEDTARVDALIAAADAATEAHARAARIDLWVGSRGCGRTPAQEARIAELCTAVAAEVRTARQAVRRAFYWANERALDTALRKQAPAFHDTRAARWFTDARATHELYRDAVAYMDAVRARRGVRASADRRLRGRAERLRRRLASPEFIELTQHVERVLLTLGKRPW